MGLDKILEQLNAGGLGDQVQSWIGKGGNLPVSPEQIEQGLGSGPLADIAERFGIDPANAAPQVSAMLPGLIDQLTPDGKLRQDLGGLGEGLGGLLGDLGKQLPGGLGDMLGGFLKR